VRQPEGRKISTVAKAMGLGVDEVDGNNAIESFKSIESAVERIRNNQGPQFIEFSTYRWLEHCGVNYDNHIGYRTEEEYLIWKKNDPIFRLQEKLLQESLITEVQIQEIIAKIEFEIKEAFAFAKESPFPKNSEAYIGEYAN
jgi:pyruvate dehydrogenase E1 component alpha subunit